jgi:thiol-disulfide isomerase/thioredoxin
MFRSCQICINRDDNIVPLLTQQERDAQEARWIRWSDKIKAEPGFHGDGATAGVLYNKALAKARSTGKVVFLVFHSTWCGSCQLMYYRLNMGKVAPIFHKYFVVQEIDGWEHQGGDQWENLGAERLHLKFSPQCGIPYWVLLNGEGKVIADSKKDGNNVGCPFDAATISYLISVVKKAAPTITKAELSSIEKDFNTPL